MEDVGIWAGFYNIGSILTDEDSQEKFNTKDSRKAQGISEAKRGATGESRSLQGFSEMAR